VVELHAAPVGGAGVSPVHRVVAHRANAYVIADSNHGYKLIGVGDLVAKEIMGERSHCSNRSVSPATDVARYIRSAIRRCLGLERRAWVLAAGPPA